MEYAVRVPVVAAGAVQSDPVLMVIQVTRTDKRRQQQHQACACTAPGVVCANCRPRPCCSLIGRARVSGRGISPSATSYSPAASFRSFSGALSVRASC